MMIRILFVGDVVGRPGRAMLAAEAPRLRESLGLHFIIANAENAAAGAGITGALAKGILEAGVDAITLGDHVWDQRGFETEIAGLERVCRPANLPAACPGRRFVIVEREGVRLGVFTVLGRQFLPPRADCPFLVADQIITELRPRTDLIVAEMHAEATSEKIAWGRYLDGRVAMVVGTHTHVPTADACVFPGGSGYITDVGMTGPYDSVLGREVQPVIQRFLDSMPRRFPVAERDVRLSGAVVEWDPEARRAVSMRLIAAGEGQEKV
ncbi:MAG: TIGR00282 family metallophosphoesterase [Opitutaceae bacterium]